MAHELIHEEKHILLVRWINVLKLKIIKIFKNIYDLVIVRLLNITKNFPVLVFKLNKMLIINYFMTKMFD